MIALGLVSLYLGSWSAFEGIVGAAYSSMKARYDGLSEWYDDFFAHNGELERESSSSALLARLLGPGEGWCLDIACGTGLHFPAVASTGRRVLGLDISRDQLGIARRRAESVVRGDATRLPFRAASFQAVVCTYLHTDIDDISLVFREVARVLRPHGCFIYLGVHPCFWGHFVERLTDDRRLVHPGYWDTGWHFDSPHWSADGLRGRVGEHHMTFAELIGSLLAAGLHLTGIEEADRSNPFADRVALVATRS